MADIAIGALPIGSALADADEVPAVQSGVTKRFTFSIFNKVPAGGSQGQALVKSSGTDYDSEWGDVDDGYF